MNDVAKARFRLGLMRWWLEKTPAPPEALLEPGVHQDVKILDVELRRLEELLRDRPTSSGPVFSTTSALAAGPSAEVVEKGKLGRSRSASQAQVVVPQPAPTKTTKKPAMPRCNGRTPARVGSFALAAVPHPSEEEHFSIRQLAELWHKGYETVRRWVLKEPGVLKTSGGTGQRSYYSISKSMAQRIYNKHST
jgi:hypothetical protein